MDSSAGYKANFEIDAKLVSKITFASHQNDVAVINALIIKNNSDETVNNLVLKLKASPEALLERTWTIDRIAAKSEIRLSDRKVTFAASMLQSLTEKVISDLSLELIHNDKIVSREDYKIEVLARNEWGGAGHMPELLASFVMPNDPAVERVLKEASRIMDQAGMSSALDGYQSKSRKRVFTIASAIWSAVATKKLAYAEPPASFEDNGQKVRTPSHVWESGIATCLDTSVLFAAALQQAGLNALIALTRGHAFCGVWLQPQCLPTLTTEDPVEIRKYIAAKELVLFETTQVTGNPPGRFQAAVKRGEENIEEKVEDKFVYALDIKQARDRGISPLASFGSQDIGPVDDADDEVYEPGLDTAPDLPSFDFGLETQADVPETPQTRVDQWRRKLLDLTKRNRLLNLKQTKTAIPLVCPDPAALEDLLAEGEKITIIPRESLSGREGERDEEHYRERTGEEYLQQLAERAMEQNQIVANADKRDLDKGMVELYRKSKADVREGGANTLFVAIGVLRWKQSADDSRSYRAPLLLVPAQLERRSASSPVKVMHHDDEAVFNMTLLEMLRQDFELEIPQLSGELPKDDSGIDVRLVWEIVRRAVKDVPGFEVREEVVLSTFSFAKYLMWKDLSDRVSVLKENHLVEHLIETPREEYAYQADFIEPSRLDEEVEPGDLFMPLPADSSQIVAVHASGKQADFILEGPPGTGKSQTIANMIAHNMALGRKVLFVSEKMAALEVVYNRLKQHGLGDFCLELHSSKTNKKAVIDHLGQAWKSREVISQTEWLSEAERLKSLRDDLNNLVSEIHRPSLSGISPFGAVGRAVRYATEHGLRLSWSGDLSADPIRGENQRRELEDLVAEGARSFAEVSDIPSGDLFLIEQDEWSFAWLEEITKATSALKGYLTDILSLTKDVADLLGLQFESSKLDDLEQLKGTVDSLLGLVDKAIKFDLEPAFSADLAGQVEIVEKAMGCVKKYRSLSDKLSHQLKPDVVAKIEAELLKSEWEATSDRFVVLRLFNQFGLRKKLKDQALGSQLNPENDLDLLIDMQSQLEQLNKLEKQVMPAFKWLGLESDLEQIADHLAAAQSLKSVMTASAADAESFIAVKKHLRGLFVEGRELLSAGGRFVPQAQGFMLSVAEFEALLKSFTELAATTTRDMSLQQLEAGLGHILDLRPKLNSWCRWVSVRNRMQGNYLGDVVDALECGGLEAGLALESFKTAYCNWLAPRLIDDRNELRTFSALEQDNKINKFKELDQKLADLSTDYIRAKLSGEFHQETEEKRPDGYNVLQHEMNKQKAHIPVRQLVSKLGGALTDLTPCLLMSPLSIAQFLPPEATLFDVVIFDEASQITVWDAVGAIARAKNVIIVGDPKQMPPTSFFDRGADDEGESEDTSFAADQESVLTEALASGVKLHRLTGHYRSKHESLIAFSNHAYYSGDLITYPACDTKESAITLHHIKDGLYQRGKRTNEKEAKALVSEVVRRLKGPVLSRQSIGIVTMNTEQQRLINDLLDAKRRGDPALEPFFDENNPDHVFVRNLETVQGDERNVIMISIGFGPTEPGAARMSMSFGALNRKGGERRLNVLITRASEEKVIFCSFESSMIDLTRTSSQAVHDLKHYLEFAERGPIALGEAVTSIGGLHAYDSDFERAVAEGLRSRGWVVHTQIGVSKFRIDLGVVNPDKPGIYLAGVECDGATYHSLPAARDRDRVRHAVLESLGWKLLRLWSTDYFQDPEGALDKLSANLDDMLEKLRETAIKEQQDEESSVVEAAEEERTKIASANDLLGPPEDMDNDSDDEVVEAITPDTGAMSKIRSFDEREEVGAMEEGIETAELGFEFSLSPTRFYDDDYRSIIRKYANHIIDHEGPVTFKYLADKIARDHGFKRTASRIQSVIQESIKGARIQVSEEDGSVTMWPDNQMPEKVILSPRLEFGGVQRIWQDLCYPEKRGLAAMALKRNASEGAIRDMASMLNLRRLTASTKTEFEQVLALEKMQSD